MRFLPSPAGAASVLAVLAGAAYFVFGELHRRVGSAGYDAYIYFLPIKIHLARSLASGGAGLLWNPYQASGEPFFANPTAGTLYPPHLLFLLLEPNAAMHAVLLINIAIGGIGMLLLARTLGLGWSGALAGALVFALGDPMSQLSGWSATHNGPWAWVPWALLCCERLLRRPTRGGVLALTAVLAVQPAAGWVVIAALTYQLVALRVAFEIVTCGVRETWRAAAAIGVALVLAPGLIAVQLLPAAELAGESFRVNVEVQEFLSSGSQLASAWQTIRDRVPPIPFLVTPVVLAILAPLVAVPRRIPAFYGLAGVVYGVLALGHATPLYGLYALLPPGAATLRYPARLFWITGFAMAVLSAFTVDALRRGVAAGLRGRAAALLAVVATVALLAWTPGGLRAPELVALGVACVSVGAATRWPRWRTAAALALAAALAVNVIAIPYRYPGGLIASVPYRQHADVFAQLAPPLTAQDRVYIVADMRTMSDFTLIAKTATILEVPDLHDYDALIPQRYVEYMTMLWHGTPVNTLADLTSRHTVTAGFRPRLLDLAAVRHVVSGPSEPARQKGLDLPAAPAPDGIVRVRRNDTALPRARYVPRIEVIRDPGVLLHRLAYGTDDLAQVAFVDTPLPDGFTGTAAAGPGTARIVRNEPEHVTIEVTAPARGFVVLADQFYPGWQASVNGRAATIHRANHVFRLVEVPSGTSRVEFHYRPASVRTGAAISATSLVIFLALLLWPARRARRGARAAQPEAISAAAGPRR